MSSAAAPEPAGPLHERAFLAPAGGSAVDPSPLPPAAKHLAAALDQLQATARSVEGALSACCAGDAGKALAMESAAARCFERAHAAFRLAVVESAAAEEPQTPPATLPAVNTEGSPPLTWGGVPGSPRSPRARAGNAELTL